MATFKALLTKLNLIEATIKNSYYNGETETLTLKKGKELIELDIVEIEKKKEETTYYAKLEGNIEFGIEYDILDDHGLRAPLIIDSVVRTKEFDETYFYNGELGNVYSETATTFKIWSPIATEVKLDLKYPDGTIATLNMDRHDKGVWSHTVKGDLDRVSYVYLLKINGEWNEATDPYAFSSTPNHKRSYVINLEKTNIDLNRDQASELKSFTDAVIYEMHVRDFTVNPNGNIEKKGKFLGVVEEGTTTEQGNPTGFDYLKTLGITHVQLLPVYDFGSVEEENQFKFYNWGYDPMQYNVPEGSYATDVYDPYSRVVELKTMISKLHKAGLRVNMDVVYNHMFDMYTSAFHQIMPGYYFRYGIDNEISNGSFCGNDVASDKLMVRKYIVESCLRWITFYGFDGFRFDLMGIEDIETMNEIRYQLNRIDPSIMLYGEGWHMPTLLDDDLQASMRNYKKLGNIGHFNDRYRDGLKGPHSNTDELGFIGGNVKKTDLAMNCLLATTVKTEEHDVYLGRPDISISYAACHDNYTLFDQLSITYKDEPERIPELHRLATSLVFVSQGIAFLHGGQEFLRTKQGVENSYMSPDEINWFDWNRRDEHMDNVEFVKGLIAIRKSFKGFRLNTTEEIEQCVTIKATRPGLIDYTINYKNEEYRVLINATKEMVPFKIESKYHVLANKFRAGLDSLGIVKDTLNVEHSSLVILKRV
ncbi:type I pullulanase [Haloplasma contractile]|uniref:Glycosyl hydrolase family 13 catalytic domain-containing protein n=1 Tax=Haloplasma contractile SSD-17B TaxID=1033810 RepID=U2EDK1_9MOLU|nr:type I pullulanase [Haloplasma contractile]ERJ13058.1 Pullulanase putative protein [Haloplasma contractile SSD-17B]